MDCFMSSTPGARGGNAPGWHQVTFDLYKLKHYSPYIESSKIKSYTKIIIMTPNTARTDKLPIYS